MENTKKIYLGIEEQEMSDISGDWYMKSGDYYYCTAEYSEDCEKEPHLLAYPAFNVIDSYFKRKYERLKESAEDWLTPEEYADFDPSYRRDITHRYVVVARVCPEADEYRANGGSDYATICEMLDKVPAAVVMSELVSSIAKRILK